MDKILRFAIVGCGHVAQRHAEQIVKKSTLVAVCDIDKEKANNLASKYNVKPFYHIDDLFSSDIQADVISVCSPNGLHAEHTIKSHRAGFHVLCEKPMAIDVHDCGKMIQEAEKANKRLFIVKQNRFNPPVNALKELILNDKLGKIYSIQLNCFWNRNNEYYQNSDWKGTKKLDGGTLFTQFSHFVDLLFWLIGDIKDVFAFGDNFHHKGITEFEDTGVVALRFYNGVIGTINYTVNSYAKNMEGSIAVFGEKGTIKVGGQYLNICEYQSIENFEINNLAVGNPPNNYGNYLGSMSNHEDVYKNVVDVLNNHGIISTNGFEGLKTVEIIDKIYNSMKRNA